MSQCKRMQRRLKNSEKLFTRKQNFRTDLHKLGKFGTSSPRVSVYIRNFHYYDARVNKMPHENLGKLCQLKSTYQQKKLRMRTSQSIQKI